MAIKMKVKLRTCEICGVKKKVVEFSRGKVCNKCQTQTSHENTDDDETIDETPIIIAKEIPVIVNDEIQSLHAKMDNLNQRFDRMEALVLGLMDLLGKINCELEMKKAEDE
jgi:uncharacterized Zn finger protein (UPF0148 family)